jgi:hypothetical protein
MRKALGSLLLAGAVLVPGVLLAHEGHHHVMGTVTAVDAIHVEDDGRKVELGPALRGDEVLQGQQGQSCGCGLGLEGRPAPGW